MQNHMFRVPDGLLCRHGWSHLLAFSTVVSPWWPSLLNGVGQTKCGIWSNGGLVRMTSSSCQTGCQQFSWNRWYTHWPYLQWTQTPGGWKLLGQVGCHARLVCQVHLRLIVHPECTWLSTQRNLTGSRASWWLGGLAYIDLFSSRREASLPYIGDTCCRTNATGCWDNNGVKEPCSTSNIRCW